MLLILDDDREVRHCLQSVFEHHGYIVATAANGAEALSMLDGGCKPDAIILDMEMPVMDGAAFIEEIMRRDASTPMIVLSAFIHRVKEDLRSAVKAIVEKPASMAVLLAEVGRWARPDLPPRAAQSPVGV